jgi:ABC-type Fe3+ transport system substrate-binding protein
MNWLLSKEGQLAQFFTSAEAPAHKELFGKGFLSLPKEIEGKAIAFRSPDLLGNEVEKKFFGTWTPLWGNTAK